jgi:8-oxo-dGTP diphosphatase
VSRGWKRAALRAFGNLPPSGRRFIVRRVTPAFTVGSMCIVRREDDGRILLVQHEYRGKWGLPGGLLKRGETIEDCALREVREETGLEIELVGPPTVVVEPEARRVDVVFCCHPVRIEVDTEHSAEVNGAEWFPLGDLPELQDQVAAGLARLAEANESIRAHLRPS